MKTHILSKGAVPVAWTRGQKTEILTMNSPKTEILTVQKPKLHRVPSYSYFFILEFDYIIKR